MKNVYYFFFQEINEKKKKKKWKKAKIYILCNFFLFLFFISLFSFSTPAFLFIIFFFYLPCIFCLSQILLNFGNKILENMLVNTHLQTQIQFLIFMVIFFLEFSTIQIFHQWFYIKCNQVMKNSHGFMWEFINSFQEME